jgi:hypothetical protein
VIAGTWSVSNNSSRPCSWLWREFLTLIRNLAVEYGAFNVQMFSDPCGEIREATEGISISGDQFSLTGFNVSERTKAVNLQFKDKLVRIERFKAPGKPYWTHPAWKHALSIKRTA